MLPCLLYSVHVQDELSRIEAGHSLDSLDMSRYLVDEPEDERLFENLKVSDGTFPSPSPTMTNVTVGPLCVFRIGAN